MAARSPAPDARLLPGRRPFEEEGRPSLTVTKLTPPRLPRTMVAREALAPLLDQAAAHTLTVIRAPSGFGKTTLCAAWHQEAAERGLKPAWVSFDRDNDEPRRAILHVLGALDRAMPGLTAEAQTLLSEDRMVPVQSLASLMLSAVLDRPEHFLLFLDDFHLLADPQVLQFFSYALLHCPDNLHFVIACEDKPRLPLAYLRDSNSVLMIEAHDLRMSAEETAELLGDASAELGAEKLAALHEATAGWAMGLKIAAAAVRNSPEAISDIGVAGRSTHWLSDFLKEHILDHLPEPEQQFLLRCAIVELLTPDLCNRLAGTAEAGTILAELVEQELFVQPLGQPLDGGDGNAWFRLHPVFRSFLFEQLRARPDADIAALHRAASEWFAEHGFWAEAIRHAMDSGEMERAADWVDQVAIRMVERSEITTLLHWIAKLPEAPLAKRLSLRVAQAWALSLTFKPQAGPVLDELEATVAALPPGPATEALKHDISGVRAIYTSVVEDRTDEALRLASAHLERDAASRSFASRAIRNVVAWANTLAGNYDAARAVLRPLLMPGDGQEQMFAMSYRQCILGFGYQIQGHLDEAERIFRAAVMQCEQRVGRRSVSATLAACCLAQVLYERDMLDEAEAVLANRFPLVDEACYPEAAIVGYRTAIRLRIQARDRAGATELLERAELVAQERGWRRMLAACAIERIRAGLPLSFNPSTDFPDADAAAPEAEPLARESRLFRVVAEARCLLLIRQQRFDAARALLDRLIAISRSINNYPDTLRLHLMQALVLEGLGDMQSADELIAASVTSAAERGFARTIKDTLPAASLRRFATTETATRLEPRPAKLLSALVAAEPRMGRTLRRHDAPPATIFSVLTSREIDVLMGVSEGLSNKQIARKLYLTPETVKWHMKHILRKLNVGSRTQAVERAVKLGLTIG